MEQTIITFPLRKQDAEILETLFALEMVVGMEPGEGLINAMKKVSDTRKGDGNNSTLFLTPEEALQLDNHFYLDKPRRLPPL